MDFLKKHYEKIILSLVLLGLVGALVFLPVLISIDQQKLDDMKNAVLVKSPKPLPFLDMSQFDNVLGRLNSPVGYDFSTTNKLFNPMQWQITVDKKMIKIKNGSEIGAEAVVITKIAPLYFVLTLDSVITNALGAPPRYVIDVERPAAVELQALREAHTAVLPLWTIPRQIFSRFSALWVWRRILTS